MTLLLDQWEKIAAQAATVKQPTLLYREPELAVRVMREEFNAEYRGVIIDDQRLHGELQAYIGAFNPELADRVKYYDREAEGLSLFEFHHVHEQVHKALDRKVWLPSGGSLIIEHTEALTVIDVDTGSNFGTSSLEATVFHNNMEAADEIAKQLRLRDIGGIIVIDFIDMENRSNRAAVVERFRNALSHDKTRPQIFDISDLGLVEMTRKRIGEGLLTEFSGYLSGVRRPRRGGGPHLARLTRCPPIRVSGAVGVRGAGPPRTTYSETRSGGNGSNFIHYGSFTAGGVTVDLSAGTGTGTGGISNFQNVDGSSNADTITGSGVANTLNGGAEIDGLNGGGEADTLNGGTDADAMNGGTGNDTYFVDNAGDAITEAAGDTLDRLLASATYVLAAAAAVEFIMTTSSLATTAIDLTGSDTANTIYGNAGANTLGGAGDNDLLAGYGGDDNLNGGAGDDRLYGGDGQNDMAGGAGNDWYIVASLTDTITEAAGEGTLDRVFTSLSYTLTAGAHVEIMIRPRPSPALSTSPATSLPTPSMATATPTCSRWRRERLARGPGWHRYADRRRR